MRRLAALVLATAAFAARADPPDPTYLPALVEKARALRLADDRGWLLLGHYRPRWLGGWKSEADGPIPDLIL